MTGITFPMWAGDVPVMLPDLLTRVGNARVRDSVWTLRGVEAAGDPGTAQELETISQQGLALPGVALIALAERGVQIIDGELVGQRGNGAEPWIVLRGVDSAWWGRREGRRGRAGGPPRRLPRRGAQPLPR
jgi:hypothetical protein